MCLIGVKPLRRRGAFRSTSEHSRRGDFSILAQGQAVLFSFAAMCSGQAGTINTFCRLSEARPAPSRCVVVRRRSHEWVSSTVELFGLSLDLACGCVLPLARLG